MLVGDIFILLNIRHRSSISGSTFDITYRLNAVNLVRSAAKLQSIIEKSVWALKNQMHNPGSRLMPWKRLCQPLYACMRRCADVAPFKSRAKISDNGSWTVCRNVLEGSLDGGGFNENHTFAAAVNVNTAKLRGLFLLLATNSKSGQRANERSGTPSALDVAVQAQTARA